jgi:hypothetical protein
MIVVLRRGTTDEQRDLVVRRLADLGLEVRALHAGGKPLLHVVAGPTRLARRVLRSEHVEALVPTSGPRIRRDGRRVYPYHFLNWCTAGVLIFGLMVLLAGQFPPGTLAAVDTQRPPETLAWPWYLRAPRAWLLLFSPERRWLGWAGLAALGLAALCLPRLDRTRGEGLARRWPFVAGSLALLLAAVVLTLRGAGW